MSGEASRRLHGFLLGALLAGSALGQQAPPPPPEPASTQVTVQGGVESQNLNSGSENLQAIGAFQTSIRRNEPVLDRARKGSPEAREIAARLVSSYEGLGIAYVQNGENGKAIEALTRAIELSRDVLEREDENALYARSLAYGRTGRPQDSIADLEKLLQGKDNLQYREELAAAYVKIGRKDDAAGQYRKLLESNPNNAWVHFQLGYLSAEKEDYAGAAEEYEKAITSRGQLPETAVASAWNNLGTAYFHLCRRDEAIAAFKKAAALNPAFSEGLGAAYLLKCPAP
jgi:tetratricopeptide (TPR) repeat protein